MAQSSTDKLMAFIMKLLVLGGIGFLIYEYGDAWGQTVQLSALCVFLVVGILVLYPKMAAPLIDAIGDRIRGYDDKKNPPGA